MNIVGSDNQQEPICDNKTCSCEHIVGEFSDLSISPVYKKGDVMDKKNYRPILLNLSKVFEVIVQQSTMVFNERFSPHLSGFSKKL